MAAKRVKIDPYCQRYIGFRDI